MATARRWVAWFCATALCLGVGRAAADEGHTRVAVVVLLQVNADAREIGRLVGGLERAITAAFDVNVMAQGDASARVAGLPADCLARTECIQQMVRGLGVDDILSLAIVRMGDEYQVSTTWIDGHTGGLVERSPLSISATSPDLIAAFAGHVDALLPHLGRRSAVRPVESPVPQPATRGRHLGGAFWIASGIAGVALATGTTLGILALSDYSGCSGGSCRLDEVERLANKQLAADVAFSVALAAGGAAAWLYYRARSRSPERSTAVRASVGPSSASLLYEGRF